MPVSAIRVSFLWLGEKIWWHHIIGILFVLFSIVLVSYKRKPVFGIT
ncbi:MAG: hypothetical protein ACO1OC_01820 [Tuberibacillus sp.]